MRVIYEGLRRLMIVYGGLDISSLKNDNNQQSNVMVTDGESLFMMGGLVAMDEGVVSKPFMVHVYPLVG